MLYFLYHTAGKVIFENENDFEIKYFFKISKLTRCLLGTITRVVFGLANLVEISYFDFHRFSS